MPIMYVADAAYCVRCTCMKESCVMLKRKSSKLLLKGRLCKLVFILMHGGNWQP